MTAQQIGSATAGAEAKFEIERLSAISAHAFASFTYKRYQWHLQATHPFQVWIGAWRNGQPAGLLFMEFLPADRSASILSIFVRKDLRRQGLAGRLLSNAEQACREAGAERIELVFPTGTPTSVAVEALIRSAGWQQPERKHWICKAGLRFQTAPWIEAYKLAKGFSVVPWTEMTSEMRAMLKEAEGDWIPEKLNPFDCQFNLDPLCSIVLLFEGRPVGWVIAQQHGDDTLVYGSSFVRPDLRGRGHLISAYAEACRRQIQCTNRHVGVWVVPMTYPPMAAFADRRMRPYLDSVEEFLRSAKSFHNTAEKPQCQQEVALCQ